MVRDAALPGVDVQGIARLFGVPCGPVADDRQGQVAVDELVVVDLGWAPGRVWAVEGKAEEEGASGVPLAQKFQGTADEPGLLHQVFGQMVGPAEPGVGGDPVGELLHLDSRLLGEPLLVVFRDDKLFETQVQAGRVEVSLADVGGLVPGSAQFAGQGVGVLPRATVLVADHAVAVGRHPGHQGAAGPDTRGAGGIGVSEGRSPARQRVEVRGFCGGMSQAAQAVTAKVVGEDEEEVRAVGHGFPLDVDG